MDIHAYIPRNPHVTSFHQLVEDHYEYLERTWEERYLTRYGYWRGHVTKVIWDYLDCGDLHKGFARIRCKDCGHEYLLPFSCKRRHFCPSCHERRVIEFGEFLTIEVLLDVPHRHWVFTIPKILRTWFMYDRKLLSALCRIVWELLATFLKASTVGGLSKEVCPGAVMSIQTFGEQINFNPHIHVIAADGCFCADGAFVEAWAYDTSALTEAFSNEVLKLLEGKGLPEGRVEMIRSWHHSGFQVYRGYQIPARDKEGTERLACYIVRCPFAKSRLTYMRDSAEVLYSGKTTGSTKKYSALDFLAMLTVQIPAPRQQMVRYYGHYSNKQRGMRRKAACLDDVAPEVVPAIKLSSRSWARLIAKVYLDDPLSCPKCKGQMKIIAFIEDDSVIVKILKHRDLGERPVAHAPPPLEFVGLTEDYYEDCSQLLLPEFEYEAC
jgi:Zn finger protein HypA/HybF involved in hydrogenase expression